MQGHRFPVEESLLEIVETIAQATVFESCQEAYDLYGFTKTHFIANNPSTLLNMKLPQPAHARSLVSVVRMCTRHTFI